MKKSTKIWLITATALILVGALILCCVSAEIKGDLGMLSNKKYETNRHAIEEEFKNIVVKTNTADVEILPSEGGAVEVVCVEDSKQKHAVSVKDGALTVEVVDTRKWYDYIGIFGMKAPKITVYIPAGEYGTLTVKASTGDVRMGESLRFEGVDIKISTGNIESLASCKGTMKLRTDTGSVEVKNVSAAMLDIFGGTGKISIENVTCEGEISASATTGDVNIADTACARFKSDAYTGDVIMKNVVAAGEFSVTRSAGDVRFEACDAAEITVTTGTGDVKGSLTSEKIFITKSKSGKVKVPETTSGGKCKVTTNTGNIILTIEH